MFRNITKSTNDDSIRADLETGFVAITYKDGEGNTMLHLAALADNLRVTNLLLSKGADMRAVNNRGQEPIELAIRSKGYNSTRALLDYYGDDSHEYKLFLLDLAKKSSNAEIIGLIQNDIEVSSKEIAAKKRIRLFGEYREATEGEASEVSGGGSAGAGAPNANVYKNPQESDVLADGVFLASDGDLEDDFVDVWTFDGSDPTPHPDRPLGGVIGKKDNSL